MRLSGTGCIPANCCFTEPELCKCIGKALIKDNNTNIKLEEINKITDWTKQILTPRGV
jgi:hypothetical protein